MRFFAWRLSAACAAQHTSEERLWIANFLALAVVSYMLLSRNHAFRFGINYRVLLALTSPIALGARRDRRCHQRGLLTERRTLDFRVAGPALWAAKALWAANLGTGQSGRRTTSLRTSPMPLKKKHQVERSSMRHTSVPLSPPPAELSVTMLKVLKQFRIVFKSIRHHYQEVERLTGVSGAQIWVLTYVADQPGTKVGQLATALAIHPSTASNLVRKLDASGLLIRKRIADDQRAVQLQLTQAGESALQHAPRPLIGVLQQALKDMPERRLHELHDALGHLVSKMALKDSSAQSVPLSEIK